MNSENSDVKERAAKFKRAVRHAVQDDYLCMWDPLIQIPFDANLRCPNTKAVTTCKMTVKFTGFTGDFVEQCLQALCLQQG